MIEKMNTFWTDTLSWSNLSACLESLHSYILQDVEKRKKVTSGQKSLRIDNSLNWTWAFPESTSGGQADVGCMNWNEKPSTYYDEPFKCSQVKSTQTHREIYIDQMDQSGTWNRSLAIKDKENIHSFLLHQCYISTRVSYKKKIRASLEEEPPV